MRNDPRSKGIYAYQTDIGKVRMSNEDQAAVLLNSAGEVLLIVCDGMGGQNKGDYASKMAIDSVCESFLKKRSHSIRQFNKMWLYSAVKKANLIIYDEASKNPIYKDMGTTIVACLLSHGLLIVANVGDSRAYVSTYESLTQISHDQTYVDFLYRTGKISKDQEMSHPERHVLMNALGIYPSLSLDMKVFPYSGESLLLCTDGLYNSVSENEIHAVISTDERPEQKVQSLIMEANNAGGSDNVGIAYWEALKRD